MHVGHVSGCTGTILKINKSLQHELSDIRVVNINKQDHRSQDCQSLHCILYWVACFSDLGVQSVENQRHMIAHDV